ncbi:MAG: L,D-transpeptidase [Gemmatimonadota bacterium]
MRNGYLATFLIAVGVAACGGDSGDGDGAAVAAQSTEEIEGVSVGDWDARLAAEELERGRLDPAWQRVVQLDSFSVENSTASTETFDQITRGTVNSGPTHLPLYGDVEGPSVMRLQILLDRALFSPGIIDGHWGKNTEKALYWFQHRERLPRTGRLDERTFERLVEVAGGADDLIEEHALTGEDVDGPFVDIPDDIYDKAELDCMCYESVAEKLGEMFHTSPDMLRQLNPDMDLNGLSAGDRLNAPSVRGPEAGRSTPIERLVVSDEGFYVHALDASDNIVFHFPSTLGSSFDPSPTGNREVARITLDPWWHYQPSILESVPDDEPEAKIPPGPNNAVGPVWMALSVPHYGIHGTSAPETIGYATSAGCVRLTNWDALFLADRIEEGIPVDFAETPTGPHTDAPDPPAGESS